MIPPLRTLGHAAIVVTTVVGLTALGACGGGASDAVGGGGGGGATVSAAPAADGSGGTINFYAFSVPRAGFDVLIPAFTATPAGRFFAPERVTDATVRRIVRLGFEVRVVLLDDGFGSDLAAQITRGELDSLDLLESDRVVARATRAPTSHRSLRRSSHRQLAPTGRPDAGEQVRTAPGGAPV